MWASDLGRAQGGMRRVQAPRCISKLGNSEDSKGAFRSPLPDYFAKNGLNRRSLAAVVSGPWPGAITVSSANKSKIRRECVS